MQTPTYDVFLDGIWDGFIKDSKACQIWIQKFTQHVTTQLGQSPTISIGSYQHGNTTYIAMDISQSDHTDGIALTIGLSATSIRLPNDIEYISDLVLPGIIDAFFLINAVATSSSGSLKISTHY